MVWLWRIPEHTMCLPNGEVDEPFGDTIKIETINLPYHE